MKLRRPALPSPFPAALPAALALVVSGCVVTGPYRMGLPVEIAYDCQDGKVLRVTGGPDGNSASVLVDGSQVPLQRTPGATQGRYSNGALTLYLEGDKALLNSPDRVLFGPCTLQAPPPVTPHNMHQM